MAVMHRYVGMVLLGLFAWVGKPCAYGAETAKAAAPLQAQAQAQASTPAEASLTPMPEASQQLAIGRKHLDENRLRLAAQYLQLAAEAYSHQPASIDQFDAFYLYGEAERQQDEHNQALNFHFKAKQTAEALRSPERQAAALAAIGEDLVELKDLAQAQLYLKKAADLYISQKNDLGAAKCMASVGDCYLTQNQLARAAESFYRALALFEKAGNLAGQVRLHGRIARARINQRSYPAAINELQITLRLSDSARLAEERTLSYLDLTECYDGLGKVREAVFYGGIGMSLAQRYKQLPLLERANLMLSGIYTRQGQHELALRHYRNYISLRDRLAADARTRQLSEMRLQYENEKIGKEIAVLTREKRIQELDLARKENMLWAGICLIGLLGGAALLLHRKNLSEKSTNARLQIKNIKIEQQRDQIEVQKAGLKDALGQLESSILYAKRIQDAILSASDPLEPAFRDTLIYFRPKAIVSGDFYWAAHRGDETVLVVADCTGHGVPGAFLSLVGHSTLVRALSAVPSLDPADVLTFIDEEIGRTLGSQPGMDIKEGIEMSVCVVNRFTRQLRFAGARRDAMVVCGDSVDTIAGSRRSVGGVYASRAPQSWMFKTHVSTLPADCTLYLSSDGYTDQHGADGRSKFGLPRLRALLQELRTLPAPEQATRLDRELVLWRGATEQTDDIVLVGLKID